VATIEALVGKHPVLTYFGLTFTISWGGVVLDRGAAGMTGMKAQDNPLFPLAPLALVAGPSVSLMHVSLTGTTLILTPQTTGLPLLSYGLAFAVAIWVVIALVAIVTSRRRSRPARPAAAA
jgi:hypothetical protein